MTARPLAAGWYQDPTDPEQIRYWDGQAWTGRHQSIRLPPPPSPVAMAKRDRRGMSGWMWAVIVLVVVLAGAFGAEALAHQSNKAAKDDIVLMDCRVEPNGQTVAATLTLTNHTQVSQDYAFDVIIAADGKEINRIPTLDVDWPSGYSRSMVEKATFSAGVTGHLTCTVASVVRTPPAHD